MSHWEPPPSDDLSDLEFEVMRSHQWVCFELLALALAVILVVVAPAIVVAAYRAAF